MIILKEELVALDPSGRPCEICKKHMHDHEWANLDMNGFVTDCNFHYCECSEDDQLSSIEPGIGLWCIVCDREIIFDPSDDFGLIVGESGKVE